MSEGDFVDAKKVASGGYLHPLQAPFCAAAAIEHRPVRRRHNIGRCIRDRGKEYDENQRDASTVLI
jgi:hypothetical protein